MSIGPCLCGDPYCGSCGDPGAAALEDFMELLYETVKEYSEQEAAVFLEAGKKAVTDGREWMTYTRRTDDPKLAWLEAQFSLAGIDHRRQGETWHAPVLQIRTYDEDRANDILFPVDDIPDDDPRWNDFMDNLEELL